MIALALLQHCVIACEYRRTRPTVTQYSTPHEAGGRRKTRSHHLSAPLRSEVTARILHIPTAVRRGQRHVQHGI